MTPFPAPIPRFRGRVRWMAAAAAIASVSLLAGPATAQNVGTDERLAEEAAVDSTFGKFLAGRYARERGDMAAAVDYYERALAEDPDSEVLRFRTYRMLLAADRFADAVALASSITDLEEDRGQALLVLVVDALKKNDIEAASGFAERLPAGGLNALIRPVVIAWIRADQGEPEAARAALEALSSDSNFLAFQALHRALIDDAIGDRTVAEESYRAMSGSRTTRSLRGIQAFTNYLLRQDQRLEAEALFDEVVPADAASPLVLNAREKLRQPGTPDPFVANAAEGIAEALYGAARGLVQNGAREDAVVHTRLALQLRPDFQVAMSLLGNIFEGEGRWADANAAYGKIDPASALGWNARIRTATNLDRLGETEEAMTILRAMADERPERTDALVSLADMLRFDRRWDEAVAEYDRAIGRLSTVTEGDWQLLYSRGIALERSKNWVRAEADFLRALELQPDEALILNYLGYSWVERGENLDRARGMIEKAVDLRPRDGYIVDSLGWVLFRLGQFDEAVRQLERAVSLRPTDAVINEHLGDAYWRVGRRLEAQFQWQRALTFEPDEELIPIIEKKLADGLDDI